MRALWTILLSPALMACPAESVPGVPNTPTWHEHVAPIIGERCVSCHQPGEIGPFPLETYEQVASIADWVATVVESGEMPPWDARDTDECSTARPLKHDPRPTQAEIDILRRWADTGATEGDDETAVLIPDPIDLGLSDLTHTIPPITSHEVAGTGDSYWCFVFDPQLTETHWLTGMEVLPDQREVVHHALVWLDETGEARSLAGDDGKYECFGSPGVDGELVGGWVPNAGGLDFPPNSGRETPEGAVFVMQLHYHGTGGVHDDASRLGLRFTDEEPELAVSMTLLGNAPNAAEGLLPGPADTRGVEFRIPAGASAHVETSAHLIDENIGPEGVGLWLVGPHMHLAGVDQKVDLLRAPSPDPPEECLVHADTYDFNWQRLYQYDEPDPFALPRIRRGDTIRIRCTYDNTTANPLLREGLAEQGLDAPIDIRLGDGTLDEMCLAVIGVVF